MNPGWIILSAIVGGLLAIGGTLLIEFRKRKQLEKDFKKGVSAEITKILPELIINHYIACVDHNKDTLKWELSILYKFKEIYPELSKCKELINKLENILNLLKDRDFLDIDYNNRVIYSNFIKFPLSFLEEKTTSFSLFEKEL